MLLGTIGLPFAFVLTFAVPSGFDPTVGALWALVAFIAAATFFSLFQVPYIALPAELTDGYRERTRLLTWRVVVLTLDYLEAVLALGVESLDIARLAGAELGVPVHVENDVKAAALGAAAVREDAGSMAYLNLGTGVAAGIVIGGRLWRGSRGTAGEVGHLPVDPHGRVCGCGQRGCIETLCGGGAVGRAWGRPGQYPVLDVYDAADAGDAELGDQLVSGDDGTRVAEALLRVDRALERDAGVLDREHLLHRQVLDDHGERRGRDDVGVAERARGFRLVVLRRLGEDGARELAHLLPADEVGGRRRELPAEKIVVHGHPSILSGP